MVFTKYKKYHKYDGKVIKVRRKKKTKKKNKSMHGYPSKLSVGPQLKSRKIKFRYCDKLTLAPAGASVSAFHVFSANGLYDPDITGTGHQPIGFDQWMAFYNHYTVIGSKISVTFVNADVNQTGIVGITLDDDNTPISTVASTLMEQPNCAYAMVNTREGSNKTTLSLQTNPLKFLTKKVDDGNVTGDVSNNPAEQVYFTVWADSHDGAVMTPGMQCIVTIDYVAVLKEQKQLGQS